MLCEAALYFALNMGSSVSIIVVNKYLFSIFHFNYPTLVTFVHFAMTTYVTDAATLSSTSFSVAPGNARDHES